MQNKKNIEHTITKKKEQKGIRDENVEKKILIRQTCFKLLGNS